MKIDSPSSNGRTCGLDPQNRGSNPCGETIPLLSPKPLRDYTAEEYKVYVTSLYHKREPRPSTPKRKKLSELAVKARILKNGRVSVTTRREPKYVTDGEFLSYANVLGVPQSEFFVILKSLNFVIATHEEAERIAKEIESLPWPEEAV